MDSPIHVTGEFGEFLVWAGGALFLLLHVVLAMTVTGECNRLQNNRREPMLLNAFGWLFVTLLTGMVGFVVFWVMHYSSLRDPTQDPVANDNTKAP